MRKFPPFRSERKPRTASGGRLQFTNRFSRKLLFHLTFNRNFRNFFAKWHAPRKLQTKMQNHWPFSSNNIYFCKYQKADEKKKKRRGANLEELNSAHRHSQSKCQLVQTRYIKRIKLFLSLPYVVRLFDYEYDHVRRHRRTFKGVSAGGWWDRCGHGSPCHRSGTREWVAYWWSFRLEPFLPYVFFSVVGSLIFRVEGALVNHASPGCSVRCCVFPMWRCRC